MVPDPPLGALREHLDQTLDRLALPGTDLVRMDLVLRGDLLKRPVAPKRLQRHLRLQLSRKPPSLDLSGPHGEKRTGAVQRLDLALLVHTQHQGPFRRAQIQPDDVSHLLHKQRVR